MLLEIHNLTKTFGGLTASSNATGGIYAYSSSTTFALNDLSNNIIVMTTIDSHINQKNKDFQTGRQRRRSENSHLAPNFPSRATKMQKSFPKVKKDFGECKFFNTPQGCHAVGCGFQHLVIPGVSYCLFFNTPEGCRRGNTCGFVHSADTALPRSLPQTGPAKLRRVPENRPIKSAPSQFRNQNNAQPGLDDVPLNSARFKSLCHFFNSPAGCKFGDQCGFVHKVITPNVTVCHFYGTEKGCQAAQCGFVHIQQQQ